MEEFGNALRERARTLGLSLSEVARRAGLGERRFVNYVTGEREPDLATLVRICRVLGTTPNDLLGFVVGWPESRERDRIYGRLLLAARALSDDDLRLVIRQVEAVAAHRRSSDLDGQ
jgi:transcriptional regulator with XRE-family HTH domain